MTYTYMAKNAGTNNLMLRIETTDASGTTNIIIVNGVLQKSWTYDGTEWTDISSTYSTQYNTWDASFLAYRNSLADWAGAGGWTYTAQMGIPLDTMISLSIRTSRTLYSNILNKAQVKETSAFKHHLPFFVFDVVTGYARVYFTISQNFRTLIAIHHLR